MRNDPRNEVLLRHNNQPQYGGENKAMDNRSAHDQPFLPDQTCRRNARRHILWRDHFAHHSTRRISGCHKDGAEIEPAGRHDLQVAEKRVAGSVAPAQEAGNPAEEH